MKHSIMMLATGLALVFTTAGSADDASEFEINKQNCNLPMKKIRQLLPDKKVQQEVLQRCMDKATKEHWQDASSKK